MSKLNIVDLIALLLVVVGGLNWGLMSINWGWNLVALLLGTGILATVVYALVGISAVYVLLLAFKLGKKA